MTVRSSGTARVVREMDGVRVEEDVEGEATVTFEGHTVRVVFRDARTRRAAFTVMDPERED